MLWSSYHPMPQCVDLFRIVNISKLKAYLYTYILTLHVNFFVRSPCHRLFLGCGWGVPTFLPYLRTSNGWLLGCMLNKYLEVWGNIHRVCKKIMS